MLEQGRQGYEEWSVFGIVGASGGVCGGTLVPAQSVDTKGQTLREIARFDLPGPPGKRFDYLTIDGVDHWLLSAHYQQVKST